MGNELLQSFLIITNQNVKADINRGIEVNYNNIDKYIENTKKFLNVTLTEDEYKLVFHDIEQRFSIKHSKGCAIFDDYDQLRDWYHEENIEDPYFWTRYKRYLEEFSSLNPKSIELLDKTTLPQIMNCLGNPTEEFEGIRLRRGLVIGDVQSGKTATYSGLICKAVDAGYKVVILLAGITESLRQQTQQRIDEGIVGLARTMNPILKTPETHRVGVGLDMKEVRATSLTTQAYDFIATNDNIVTSLASHKTVLLVIKKNVSVLNKLYNWLKNNNYDPSKGYIDCPLLLIDDEADNASLNTNKDETNPTKTNAKIRQICALFKNATYVGFTATPFANCFIDPDSVDSMKNADLFPENFMYVLPSPSTYIGAKKIFDEDGAFHRNVRFITDIEEPDYASDEYKDRASNDIDGLNNGPFYYKHSKNWDGVFPKSLTHSMYCFFLANTIRDLRGDSGKPRSMLVNMSRFVKVQRVIKEHVEKIYNDFKSKIEFSFSGTDADKNLPLYKTLEELWNKHYSFIGDISIDRVLHKENLIKAIKDIKIVVVNGSKNSNKLDYKKNPSLRVIAVGGIALSRGLTLEGLLTSYFYRNTATFDVLMQMGRWFGYRPKYEDIFQIWTTMASARWYDEISKASEDLKERLRKMFDQHLTPKDFGIKVRDNCEELQITASNKMRMSFDLNEQVSFYGNLHETSYISLNTEQNKKNVAQTKALASQLWSHGYNFKKSGKGAYIVRDVPKSLISSFVGGIVCSKMNPSFNEEYIKDFIDDTNTIGLDSWDVVFQGGESETHFDIEGLEKLTCAGRAIHIEHNAVVVSSRRRLLNTSAGKLALSEEQIAKAVNACKAKWEEEGSSVDRTIPSKAYFEHLPNRKPILIVMLIVPKPPKENEDEEQKLIKFRSDLGQSYVVAFAMGFPGVKGVDKAKHYKVNKVYYTQNLMDEPEELDDEDE